MCKFFYKKNIYYNSAVGQLGAVNIRPYDQAAGRTLLISPHGRSIVAAREAAHCRIVMAEGRRSDGQPTWGVWPKASLLSGTQVTRVRIYG